ncbi:MAG: MopE-related protein [Candidatus Woesearchaeota archaeon]|nr:MopE-related protein [Candidatus Woesearchaeota archaeon]
MVKKRVSITLSIISILFLIVISPAIYSFVGPVLENGDSISKVGDYYVMNDGVLTIKKIGVTTQINIRRKIQGADGVEQYDRSLVYAATCAVTVEGQCCSQYDASCWPYSSTAYECTKCDGTTDGSSKLYQFKACDQQNWYETSKAKTITDKNIDIPLKEGDVIKVYSLNADESKTDIKYTTTGQMTEPICINENGIVSDEPIAITTTAKQIPITLETPLKHVKLMYLTGITYGTLADLKILRVMKDSHFNSELNNLMNFGLGDTASWTCNNDQCDSAGTSMPHVIWYQSDPSKWDDLTLEKITLTVLSNNKAKSKNADKFKFCVISGCDETAEEKCNGRDDNCNGKIDEGCDADKDGYISSSKMCSGTPLCADNNGVAIPCKCNLTGDNPDSCCKLDEEGKSMGTDCNDNEIKINPKAAELCSPDTADNNCDGNVNEGCAGDNNLDCNNSNGFWVGPGDLGACCGEDTNADGTADKQEYFSKWIKTIDPIANNIDSACWASKPMKNLDIADPSTNKSLHYNGSFYGCSIPADYSKIKDTENTVNANIISRNIVAGQSCTNIGDETLGYYYCSYRGVWRSVNGLKSEKLDVDPAGASSECCPEDYCWDGNMGVCVDGSASSTPGADYDKDGIKKKCVFGEWQDVVLKTDQTGIIGSEKECGTTQCNYDGDCVNSDFWENDYYCDEGEWTTRTALVANQLVLMAKSASNSPEYTLSCDDYENALNDLQYFETGRIPSASAAKFNLINSNHIDKANKFCVINYKEGSSYKTAVGTSLNTPVNDPSSSFLIIFEESRPSTVTSHYNYCDGVIETGEDAFLGCNYQGYIDGANGAKTNMWYNPKSDMLIYSTEDINPSASSVLDNFIKAVRSPISYIKSFFVPQDTSSQDFISTSKFDRLYINKLGEKAIRGYVDEDAEQMSIVYENVGVNVCDIAGQFIMNNGNSIGAESDYMTCNLGLSDNGKISYQIDSRNSQIIGQRDNAGQPGFWSDMTAKIRLDSTIAQAPKENPVLITGLDATQVPGVNEAGFPVQFTATLGSNVDTTDMIYYWDFGDSKVLSGKDISLIQPHYYKPRTTPYTYKFKVIDKNLDYDEKTKTIPINGLGIDGSCTQNWQCTSNFCNSGNKCSISSCSDSLKGPGETDVNCGGSCPVKCAVRKACIDDSDCTTDICQEGVCANETNEEVLPECSDLRDNDEDGLIDYPADPGCINATDNDEENGLPGVGENGTHAPQFKYVFITSGTWKGGLAGTANGGITDGDADCQAEADAVPKLSGKRFVAWLSTTSVDAKDRVNDTEYRLVDNVTVVAFNKIDLTDGSINHQINKYANGDIVSGQKEVWTGTTKSGTTAAKTCGGWNKGSSSTEGATGISSAIDNKWTNYVSTRKCDNNYRLYCFEVQ